MRNVFLNYSGFICLVSVCIFFIDATIAQEREVIYEDRPVTVDFGERKKLTFYWGLNADCSVTRGFCVIVETPPKRGALELKKEPMTFTRGMLLSARSRSSDWIEERRKCVGRAIEVINMYYTANVRFFGEEIFELSFISASRPRERRQRWRIYVR